MSYTTTFTVDASPARVYRAILNVRGWWSGTISGDTDQLGRSFTYRVEGVHTSTQRIDELVPGKRVLWTVTASHLAFTRKRDEWTGTSIRFDLSAQDGKTRLRFTHAGLESDHQCYADCSTAWAMLIKGNLKRLVVSGQDQPDVFARATP